MRRFMTPYLATPLLIALFLTTALTLGACERSGGQPGAGDPPDESATRGAWTPIEFDQLDTKQQAQLHKAIEARDALATTLKGELMRAIQSQGPVHAVEVCHTRAPQIAQEIGERFDVQIGRTALKLRNPSNTGPDWARFIEDSKVSEPLALSTGTGGELGVAYPILLENACIVCHGTDEQVAPAVRRAIAERYPDDRATGFAPGDHRGWFWVQVPAID